MTKPSKKKSLTADIALPEKRCGQCVYKTKNSSDLRRHERRHDDVKFPCDVCNMPFMTLGHLGGHKRSAHGDDGVHERPKPELRRRECRECDYTTLYGSDMLKHVRKHETNEYHCPTCNYPFGHTSTLLVHMRKYHGQIDLELEDIPAEPAKTYRKGQGKQKLAGKDLDDKDTVSMSKTRPGVKGVCHVNYLSKPDLTNKSGMLKAPGKSNGRNNIRRKRKRQRRRELLNEGRNTPDQRITRSTRSHTNVALSDLDREPNDNSRERLHQSKGVHKNSLKVRLNYKDENKRTHSAGEHWRKQIETEHRETTVRDMRVSLDVFPRDKGRHDAPKKETGMNQSFVNKQDHSSIPRLTVHSCKHCAFRTNDLATFRRHTNRHANGQFRCQLCQMPFLFRTNLDRHMQTKHEHADDESSDSSFEINTNNSQELLKCELCQYVTYSYKQLEEHLKQHDAGPIREGKSNKEFATEVDKDSDAQFSFDDKDPDLSFSLDDEIDRERSYIDDISARTSVSESHPVHNDHVNDNTEPSVNKQSSLNADLNERVTGEQPSKGVLKGISDESNPNEDKEEWVACVEEYSCIHCNYVTLDKKFIKLHTTMHGYSFFTPKKVSRKASTDDNVLGYKTRIVRLDDDIILSHSVGNKSCATLDLNNVVKLSKDNITNTKHLKAVGNENPRNDTPNDECTQANGTDSFRDKSESRLESTNDENNNVHLHRIDKECSSKAADVPSKTNTKESSQKRTNDTTIQHKKTSTKSDEETNTDQISAPLSPSTDSVTSPNLFGRMTREEFKQSRKFYKEEQTEGKRTYECKICASENIFTSKTDLFQHFKRFHKKIRQHICATCNYCNGPFPKLD